MRQELCDYILRQHNTNALFKTESCENRLPVSLSQAVPVGLLQSTLLVFTGCPLPAPLKKATFCW